MLDTKKFHAHLDECERCRKNPFDLCRVGVALMNEATGKRG